jgi:alkaline phosphatase
MLRVWKAILLGVAIAVAVAAQTSYAAKNVILMIADGAGFNTWNATSMYQGRWDAAQGKSKQVYDQPGWRAYACSTYPLNTSKAPTKTGAQDGKLVYDPAKAWNGEAAYDWLKKNYTDSAAAATALSTGRKTYNHAINWSDLDKPQGPTMSEAAKRAGRSVGVITSVPWSHATPAGLSNAHSAQRDEYEKIAQQMVTGGVMDVIMGCGNPDFDNNGRPLQERPEDKKTKQKAVKKAYKYVGGAEQWKAIEAARAQQNGTYQGFRPISTKAEFEALAAGAGPLPAKVLGTAQVASTLQQSRLGSKTADPALDAPLNTTVPDLATMARGAINVLHQNPQGFFLLIEGGAVDWANHKNQAGRMIQEQADFVKAVEAVVAWVEANSNWNETLVVLTADHETGLLWGPKSDTVYFDPIVDRGAGRMPEMKYHSKSHTNSLVPLYARGAGSELFARLVVGQDPVRGAYVDNTGVARLLQYASAGIPLPGTAAAGSRGLIRRDRSTSPVEKRRVRAATSPRAVPAGKAP